MMCLSDEVELILISARFLTFWLWAVKFAQKMNQPAERWVSLSRRPQINWML